MDKYEVLEKYYGYQSFRDRQEEVIDSLLDRKDTIAVLATGVGKSVCFQIPAILAEGLTIVISPLISLMCDQVRELNNINVRACYLNSSLSDFEIQRNLALIKKDEIKVLYMSPEGLINRKYIELLSSKKISYLVIDEAHCVSLWGMDFRQSYQEIKGFINRLNDRPCIACFTATANFRVIKDIEEIIGIDSNLVVSSFDRPNLSYNIYSPNDKFAFLLSYLSNKNESGIIYSLTRKTVMSLFEKLNKLGYSVTYYHGGLDSDIKAKNQNDFISGRKKIIVASISFGLGINKRDSRFVLCYDIPQSIEDLVQEWGRASRDGAYGECVLLFSKKDIETCEFFIDKTKEFDLDKKILKELKSIKRKKLYELIKLCNSNKCIHNEISLYFGERPKYKCFNCSNCYNRYGKKEL